MSIAPFPCKLEVLNYRLFVQCMCKGFIFILMSLKTNNNKSQ